MTVIRLRALLPGKDIVENAITSERTMTVGSLRRLMAIGASGRAVIPSTSHSVRQHLVGAQPDGKKVLEAYFLTPIVLCI
jgi:hypothetical protein